jgi:hypothetical protein
MNRIPLTFAALIALSYSAFGQAEPQVPFDLEKFQPVLSQCRLHSPSTSPATVSNGNFGGYELPGRFYLGEGGTTMVLATTDPTRDRERSELRHNAGWSFLGPEKRLTARLRFDKPVALGGQRSRLHLMQIYGTGTHKGPTVLVTWHGSWDDSGDVDVLRAYVKGSTTHELGPRPDGFFDLDVRIEEGVVRIFIDDELKVEDDVSNKSYAGGNFFFKTGSYNRGIAQPHAVEFDSLSISTGPPTPSLILEPSGGESTRVSST